MPPCAPQKWGPPSYGTPQCAPNCGLPNPMGHPKATPKKWGPPPPVGPHCAPQKCRFPASPRRCRCILGRPLGTPAPHSLPCRACPTPTRGQPWCHPSFVPPSSCCPTSGLFLAWPQLPPPPPLKGGGCGGGAAWGPTVSCGSIPTNMGWGERGRMAWGDLWVLWGGRWQGVGGAVGWGCCGVADDIGWPMARDGGC